MIKVITFNANGIRAAAQKGFFEWLATQDADVVCIQETKAQMEHHQNELFYPSNYHCYYHDAKQKGYSGVGIYCKLKPKNINLGLGWPHADDEGRYIQADFDNCSIASFYMPSGTSGEERQKVKFQFMDHFLPFLKECITSKRAFIICGDWNIVHKQIDIKNWASNQKHSGCLPEERAWLDQVFSEIGLVDAFRVINQEPHQYTWWSHRGQAYAKNVGWRIDYQVVTPLLQNLIKSVEIYKEQKFSDHAPLIINYDFTLQP